VAATVFPFFSGGRCAGGFWRWFFVIILSVVLVELYAWF
jgi:hypothetical protein